MRCPSISRRSTHAMHRSRAVSRRNEADEDNRYPSPRVAPPPTPNRHGLVRGSNIGPNAATASRRLTKRTPKELGRKAVVRELRHTVDPMWRIRNSTFANFISSATRRKPASVRTTVGYFAACCVGVCRRGERPLRLSTNTISSFDSRPPWRDVIPVDGKMREGCESSRLHFDSYSLAVLFRVSLGRRGGGATFLRAPFRGTGGH